MITPTKGRDHRLLFEWQQMDYRLAKRPDISYKILTTNELKIPLKYLIEYRIKSICGVENLDNLLINNVLNKPLFSSLFQMIIDIPDNYPCIDAPPSFCFVTDDGKGNPVNHPWHPNIRFFGCFAGRVCLNMPDTYTNIVWGVERVALYLHYDIYHADLRPPYPEDLKVAQWVREQAEPHNWLNFN